MDMDGTTNELNMTSLTVGTGQTSIRETNTANFAISPSN